MLGKRNAVLEIPSDASASAGGGIEYSGFWRRFIALNFDSAILTIFGVIVTVVLSMVMGEVGGLIGSVIYVVVAYLYFAVMESSARQATFGKVLVGIKVTNAEGGRLTFMRALLRTLAKIISGIPLGIGFLLAAFTSRKQALHDIITKCVVVREGQSHILKAIIITIVVFVLAMAACGAYFYYVYMPQMQKEIAQTMKEAMKEPGNSAPAMRPAPPAASSAVKPPVPSSTTAPQAVNDPAFDKLFASPLSGKEEFDKFSRGPVSATRAGPAILQLGTFFPSQLWLKFYLPVLQQNEFDLVLEPEITIDRITDQAGKDYYNPANTFEKAGSMFVRAELRHKTQPVSHLAGSRTVHFEAGLGEQNIKDISGKISIAVPTDVKSVSFKADEIDKEKSLNNATIMLKLLKGQKAVLHYRGASENLSKVRAYGTDGKEVARDSYQPLPEKQNVDQNFFVKFKSPVTKIEVIVATSMVTHEFPFVLTKGGVAGPPSTATAGTALPPASQQGALPAASEAPQTKPAEVAAVPANPPVTAASQADAAAIEAVYSKYHRALQTGKFNDMLKHVNAAQRAELETDRKGNEAATKFFAKLTPKSYSVIDRKVGVDGKSALLAVSGMATLFGSTPSQMYGKIEFLKENNEWKVGKMKWDGTKPDLANTPLPVSSALENPQVMMPVPAPSKAEAKVDKTTAEKEAAQRRVTEQKALEEKQRIEKKARQCVFKPVMTNEDIERCRRADS